MKVYTDAARDESVAGFGWYIFVSPEQQFSNNRYLMGNYTSMESEYYAMLDGLRYARRQSTEERIEVYCDCQPLVEKMRVPDADSDDWYDRRKGCHRLLNKFSSWSLQWIPRGQNEIANRLAYEALEQGRQEL